MELFLFLWLSTMECSVAYDNDLLQVPDEEAEKKEEEKKDEKKDDDEVRPRSCHSIRFHDHDVCSWCAANFTMRSWWLFAQRLATSNQTIYQPPV